MEEIYIRYSKTIYRYLYSLTKNHEISEELMQETFCTAIKAIDKFRGESSVLSWLCAIAKNKWKNYLSKNNKIHLIELDESIGDWILSDDLEEKVISGSKIIKLQEEINILDEELKELMYLRVNGEYSFKQIGEILNKNETWARVNFFRIKNKLKEKMKNE